MNSNRKYFFALLLLAPMLGCAAGVCDQASGGYRSYYIVDGRMFSNQRAIAGQRLALAEIGEPSPKDSLRWEARFLPSSFAGPAISVPGGHASESEQRSDYSLDVGGQRKIKSATATKAEAAEIESSVDEALLAAKRAGAGYLL